MKWLSKLEKDIKIVLIIGSIVILISGLLTLYATINAPSRLETLRRNSSMEFISLDEFKTFVTEKELTSLEYDVEKDILTGILKEEAKIKYGITGSGRVALTNISKLIEENQIINEVVLETINEAEKIYLSKPINHFATTVVSVILFSVIYLILFRPIRNNSIASPSASNKGSYTSSNKNEEFKEKVESVKLSDVKGHDEIKEDLEFLIKLLKNPKRYEKLGARVPKGVLLFGPPGTGKTMIAKAMANEVGIPFIATGGSDFVEKYVGVGAKRVREIFAEAKKHEKAIIYIDEIDAIGRKRSGDNDNDERINTLNALLIEMDGFRDSSGIMVIASTNRLDILDEALLRPGRFDKHIAVNPPDYKGRLDILKLYAKNKRLDKDVSLEKIAAMTRGFSGADLANLLNEAAMLTAFRDKDKTTMQEIDDAFYRILTKGDKKKSFQRSEDDTKLTAWHEAGHAIVSKLIAKQKVNKVTIIPSTSGAGGITLMEPKEGSYYSKEDLENMVKVSYGGRAAEYILLGDENKVTTGASNDIEKATSIIMAMLGSYGMSEKFGLLNLERMGGLNQEYVLAEAKEISNKLYQETIDFLEEHYDLLKEMADILIKKETLDEEEVDALILKHTLNKGAKNNIKIPNFNDENSESKEKKKRGITQLIPDKLIPGLIKNENLARKKED
ncbi:MAG: ATP-dependent zinc metalloprotease FtsH [Tissierellia bacterium]|nr:ATP-dependent zinc metalloprotease FtsH [Tissierellia bacterium]